MTAIEEVRCTGGRCGQSDERDAISDHRRIRLFRAIPFQHREFGDVDGRVLAVPKDAREIEDLVFPGGQQFLAREFGRGVQIVAR